MCWLRCFWIQDYLYPTAWSAPKELWAARDSNILWICRHPSRRCWEWGNWLVSGAIHRWPPAIPKPGREQSSQDKTESSQDERERNWTSVTWEEEDDFLSSLFTIWISFLPCSPDPFFIASVLVLPWAGYDLLNRHDRAHSAQVR